MTNSMNVQIINKETIKPSSPTPIHLRTYNLSFIDQLAPPTYVPIVLFYPSVSSTGGAFRDFCEFSQNLKKSLSETLTKFPPLAGKIKDNVSVDCNDDGVDCYEARVNWNLDELLANPDNEYLKPLVVIDDRSVEIHTGGQFFVQINLFKCGGIGIGVSFSHILCDAATISVFLNCWSALATNSGNVIVPDLTASASLPARKDRAFVPQVFNPPSGNCIARLVFDDSKLTALKAKSASPNTPNPTRVEVVTALIWKCAMTASKANRKSYAMPYLLGHGVNIRKKLTPPLPEFAFGNFIGLYVTHSEKSDANLDTLVNNLRKARIEYDDFISKLHGEKAIDAYLEGIQRAEEMAKVDALEINSFTSWCRFPLYEVNFGLGNPIWIGIAMSSSDKNFYVLRDTKDGKGIEANFTLRKEDMALFESDPLLLAYASINPSI